MIVNVVELLDLPDLEDDLARLESRLANAVRAGDPFLDTVTTHLISAGGKRLRPALTLAVATASRLGGTASATGGSRGASDDILQGAVAVELVHLASLYHDDVMDEATMRRSVESVNARWGNLIAIVAGDYLLARSAELAAELGAEIAGLLAATLGRLCQGQIEEVRTAFDPTRSEDAYMATIAGKTASLMSTACRIGALTAGLPGPEVDALTKFGELFGMAFQVRDDILDLVAADEQLGKPSGQDIAEGIYTLPVLRALAEPDIGAELRPLLGQPLGEPERDKARDLVKGSAAVAASVGVLGSFANEAIEVARAIPEPKLSAGLARVATWLADSVTG